jgi:hypothetical protein
VRRLGSPSGLLIQVARPEQRCRKEKPALLLAGTSFHYAYWRGKAHNFQTAQEQNHLNLTHRRGQDSGTLRTFFLHSISAAILGQQDCKPPTLTIMLELPMNSPWG